MDRTGEVFLKVLRNGLWKKEEIPTNAGDFSWEGIFRLAKAQSLTGIIGQAVLQCPEAAASLPDGYREKIRAFIIKNCAVHNTFNRCLVHVVSCLRSAGVEPVLLKGQGLARNWPCPELRQCGDIDLWVGEKNYDKAMNVLLPLSSSDGNDIEESLKHASLSFGMVTVEIHRFSGICTSSRKLDAIYRKYSEDGLSNGTVPLDFGDINVVTPSDNFNAFYIFSHLWHHFMAGGIGLRQICDWAMFLHSRKGMIDTGYLGKVLGELDMKEEWQVFGCIASDWLGLPSDEFPFYNPGCRAKAEKVLARILKEGNFGHERACFRKQRSQVYLFRKAGSFIYHIRRCAGLFPIFPAQTTKELKNITATGFKTVWKDFSRNI